MGTAAMIRSLAPRQGWQLCWEGAATTRSSATVQAARSFAAAQTTTALLEVLGTAISMEAAAKIRSQGVARRAGYAVARIATHSLRRVVRRSCLWISSTRLRYGAPIP